MASAEGYTLEPGSDAEACLAAAHQRVRDVALTDATIPAYLDARVAVLYDDTPALVYGPVSEHIHMLRRTRQHQLDAGGHAR